VNDTSRGNRETGSNDERNGERIGSGRVAITLNYNLSSESLSPNSFPPLSPLCILSRGFDRNLMRMLSANYYLGARALYVDSNRTNGDGRSRVFLLTRIINFAYQ